MKYFRKYRYAQAIIFLARNQKMTTFERATWVREMLMLEDVGFIHKLRISRALREANG